MPQADKEDVGNEEKKEVNSADSIQRKPRYLQAIIAVFIVPIISLTGLVWKRIQKKPFFIAIPIISLIGWTWSWNGTYNGWWVFGEKFLWEWRVLKYLPLEEFLFCPLGGILSIYLYALAHSRRAKDVRNSAIYWSSLVMGTLIFAVIGLIRNSYHPSYLFSELVTFNLLCCLMLAPVVAKEINLGALLVPILGLTVTGFSWDFIAIRYGWWDYVTTTQIRIANVPLDEFVYYLYAPTSAVSIYVFFCRLLKLEPVRKI